VETELFITRQYYNDMNEAFVREAVLECMRLVPVDFFMVESLHDFNNAMQAYLMK
jgi:hypothetical protein